MLTVEQFKTLYPKSKNPDELVEAMNRVFPIHGITTVKRIAAFIAQCGHESAGWRYFSENLNYSERALNAVFGKYFKKSGRNPAHYARQPQKIANLVYANRMGNGNTASGDGWRYRGRGPIQLTGKNNYTSFSKDTGIDAVGDPDILTESIEISLMAALWYWNTNNLNNYADKGDIKGLTKKINGGYIGLEDRIHHYNDALKLLGASKSNIVPENDTEVSLSSIGVLRRGSRGDGVRLLQRELGIISDGVFGPGTEKALMKWQEANGLQDDGIAGSVTLSKLLG